LFAVVLALTACGSTTEERGVSGAGIGAGAGAVVGAVTGLSVVQGALIGAAAGGVTGILTDESTVDLGDPIWKKGSEPPARQTAAVPTQQTAYADPAGPDLVRTIQSGLTGLGYQTGSADGLMGPKTRGAIRQYQHDHGLVADGRATNELALHIQQQGEKQSN
jgi:hypothetical protein